MGVETLRKREESDEPDERFSIEGLSLLSDCKDSLTASGRVCLELALAQEAGHPISGTPPEISASLSKLIGVDADEVRQGIIGVMHENINNEVHAHSIINPNEDRTEFVLTAEGIQFLEDEIDKLR